MRIFWGIAYTGLGVALIVGLAVHGFHGEELLTGDFWTFLVVIGAACGLAAEGKDRLGDD